MDEDMGALDEAADYAAKGQLTVSRERRFLIGLFLTLLLVAPLSLCHWFRTRASRSQGSTS